MRKRATIWQKVCIITLAVAITFNATHTIFAQEQEAPKRPTNYEVAIAKDAENGWKLSIDEVPTPIYGMVWSNTPIGENYNYSLWEQPEDFIKTTIDIDAKLMKAAGVNAIRSFSTIPPKWVTYLYEEYGIYTAINYLFARYGVSVNNKWYPRTDYSDPDVRELLIRESVETVNIYKDVPGVLLFMLGNENNYGLEWQSNEIENLPQDERHKAKGEYLYSIFGEAVDAIKKLTDKPVGIVNGDLLYIDLVAKSAPNIDFLAVNVYRGVRSYDPSNPYSSPFFEKVDEVLDKPIIYSEFGSDAYNTFLKTEDQYHQAEYLVSQWEEIFQQSYGKGRVQNALGGFVFEWMDEWWKRGLDRDLSTQGTKGSWINGGYDFDFIPEQSHHTHKYVFNNMNEEWLGIVAQSQEYYGGFGAYGKIHKRIPRAAYYALQDIWQDNIYDINAEDVERMFSKKRNEGIDLEGAVARANDIAAKQRSNALHLNWVNISPVLEGAMRESWGDNDETLLYSYTQTLNLITEIQPTPYFGARANLRFQYEALDDVFDDSYSYSLLYGDHKDNEEVQNSKLPVEFYSASFLWESPLLDIEGLYHDGYRISGGHTDWVGEGDFFGLLPESFYLADFDRNLSKAPFGAELTFHSYAEGLKIYGGPEIFKGARPSTMVKYYKELHSKFGNVEVGGLVEQEMGIPQGEEDKDNDTFLDDPLRRKSSASFGYTSPKLLDLVNITLEGGVLSSGLEKVEEGYTYSIDVENNNAIRNQAKILPSDTLAYKGRVTLDFDINPVVQVWSEYINAGLVAESRGIAVRNGGFIGENGTGNKQELKGGFSSYYGDFSLFANYLWREPLVDAINVDVNGVPSNREPTGFPSSPFVVNGNRKSLQAELILNYDQTGATYFHNFDNDDKENAKFAVSLGYHHTFYNGRTDALQFQSADLKANGDFYHYVWPRGLEEVYNLPAAKLRIVSNFMPKNKIIFTSYLAKTQVTGQASITEAGEEVFQAPEWSYSGKINYTFHQFELSPSIDWNAFGPEDYHKEFGFRIPSQWSMYMAYHFDKVSVLTPKQIVYVEAKMRQYEGISETLHEGAMGALNPLGSIDDSYRTAITVGYKLAF